MYISNLFVSTCPTCGDYIEACEACDNCEAQGFLPFNLEKAIEKAENVAELYNLNY